MFACGSTTTALCAGFVRLEFGESGGQLFCFESKWSGLTLVSHTAVSINQINAVGPAGIGLLGRVAEFIQDGRELDPEFAHARSRHQGALFFIPWAGKYNLVFDVALHLPDIARMRFRDIDDQERHLACVLVIELVEGGDLPPERRSGVAAEDHDHRPCSIDLREAHA